MDIARLLPKDVYDAAVNANAPTLANPFATMTDLSGLGSETLAQTLGFGNTTGANDIIVDTNQFIRGALPNSALLNFNANIFNDPDFPSTLFVGATNTPVGLTGFAYTANFDWTILFSVGSILQVAGTQGGVNDGVHTLTGIFFNGATTEFQWAGMTADLSAPYGDWAEQGDGTEWTIGSANSRIADYKNSFGISTTKRIDLSTADAINIQTIAGGGLFTSANNFQGNLFDNVGFSRFGEITMQNNLLADYTTVNFGGSFPVAIASSGTILRTAVLGSVAVGGALIDVKTNNTAYANQIGFNTGLAGEMLLKHTPNAGNFIATLKAASGTIAYLTDVQTGQTYNVTNVTTDRDYDANASTVGELADVLGTLITDLQNIGILS